MQYCFERCVEFLHRAVTSTTFNELLYWILVVLFMTFGVAGLRSLLLFPPIILLISIVTVAEVLEKWLAIPHVTVVSVATALIWLPTTILHQTFSDTVETILSQKHDFLLKIYAFPLMVAAFTGSLITVSDIWKARIDVSVMLAVLPTLVEVLVFSVLYLLNGGPYGWAVLTAFCLCSWDHRLIQRRASLMEKYGNRDVCLRNDLPQLMRGSLIINLMFCILASTFGAQFVSPCWKTFSKPNGTWVALEDDCMSGFFTSTEAQSVTTQIAPYALSVVFGMIMAAFLFVFARHTGAPKTQMLSTLMVVGIPVLFQATIAQVGSDESNKLHWLRGAEPLSSFLATAGLVYGWKKNYVPESSVIDSAITKVKHLRTNVKTLLYFLNVILHCGLAYVALSYCLSSDDKFYAKTIELIKNQDIDFPEEYRLSFRTEKKKLLITSVVAVLCASLAKVATAVGLLRWKYTMPATLSLYIGASTVAKGTLVGVLSCYVLLVRIAPSEFVSLSSDGQRLKILNAQQLGYSVDIITTMIFANIIANPLCTTVTGFLSRNWKGKRRAFVPEVELN